jgi:hypothetical protein
MQTKKKTVKKITSPLKTGRRSKLLDFGWLNDKSQRKHVPLVAYTVVGYSTKTNFAKNNPTFVNDGYPSKKAALKTGNNLLAEYPVIKVEDSNKNVIQVLGNDGSVYSLIGYTTVSNYWKNKTAWIEGFTSRKKALDTAKSVVGDDSAIVRVEDSDKQLIQIFGDTSTKTAKTKNNKNSKIAYERRFDLSGRWLTGKNDRYLQ